MYLSDMIIISALSYWWAKWA